MNDIYLIGEVGGEITLESVINMVKGTDKEKPLNVHIHSVGGSVYEGLAIYNYLKGLDREVNTISAGLVASIASIIFLAGNKETRKASDNDSFLIHLPSNETWGNAVDLEKTAAELRVIENQLSEIYEKETNLSKEEAIEMMKLDKISTSAEMLEKGFVSQIIEFKAVANLNKRKMSKEKKEGNELLRAMNALFAKHFGKDAVNKMMQDASGEVEINFIDLDAETNPVVGDKAEIDGKPAVGEYLMPSGETFVFEGGELKEIKPKEEEEEDEESLKEEIENLKKQLAEVNAKSENETEALAEANEKIKAIKKDFKNFKASLVSDFNYEGKTKRKEGKENARKLFKS